VSAPAETSDRRAQTTRFYLCQPISGNETKARTLTQIKFEAFSQFVTYMVPLIFSSSTSHITTTIRAIKSQSFRELTGGIT